MLVLYNIHFFGNDFPKAVQNVSLSFLDSSLLYIYTKYAMLIPNMITSSFLRLNL